MIKKIIYLAAALIGVTAISSCELKSNVYDAYNTSIFPKTEEDLTATGMALTGSTS